MTANELQKQPPSADGTREQVFEKALERHNAKDLEEAEKLYNSLMSGDDRTDHVLLYRLGIIYLQTNRYEQAIDHFTRASAINTGSVDILNNLATAYLHNNQAEEAEKTYRKGLALDPNHFYILNNLGTLSKNKGNRDEAERLFQKAICFRRDYVEAHNNLGMLYYDTNRIEEALAKFTEALKYNPEWATAHNNLGNALKSLGKRTEAEKHFRKAIEYDPLYGDAYNNLGNILRSEVKLNEATKCFRKALEINPNNDTALYNLMMLMEFSHNLDEAENLLEEMKKKSPNHQAIALLSARLCRRQGKIEEGIRIIENTGIKNGPIAMYLYFELGQLYDRAKKPAKAFEAFKKGNALHAQSHEARYVDREAYPDIIKAYEKIFTRDWVKSWTPPAPESEEHPTPVFIVGFPRSGTTLLNQILFSHPDFFVAEEKHAVEKVRFELHKKYGNFDECLADLPAEEIEELRALYYKTHNEYNDWDGKGFFVDKFPLNLTLAGIIYRLFPNAKIIFALRHPCDCVLSCFMQQFSINPGMVHFLELETGAHFYNQVMRLWLHLQETIPLNVYTHRYENVVEDFRGSIEKLLEFLEVPWDDAVLEYDKAAKKREVLANTPSYAQITEKIYDRARYRWEGYRTEMEPVLDTLLPYAEKFGYGDAGENT